MSTAEGSEDEESPEGLMDQPQSADGLLSEDEEDLGEQDGAGYDLDTEDIWGLPNVFGLGVDGERHAGTEHRTTNRIEETIDDIVTEHEPGLSTQKRRLRRIEYSLSIFWHPQKQSSRIRHSKSAHVQTQPPAMSTSGAALRVFGRIFIIHMGSKWSFQSYCCSYMLPVTYLLEQRASCPGSRADWLDGRGLCLRGC